MTHRIFPKILACEEKISPPLQPQEFNFVYKELGIWNSVSIIMPTPITNPYLVYQGADTSNSVNIIIPTPTKDPPHLSRRISETVSV